LWIWVTEASLTILYIYIYIYIYIVIIYFIKYELDEFKLNEMNVYVWCDVVSMFVNDIVCDRDIVSSKKEIPVLRLLGRALFGDLIYLRRYPDSTGTLDLYRWSLPVSEKSKEIHIVMSEIWNISWSKQMDDIWQVQTSESNSMHESSESRESSVFVCESVCVW